MGAEKMNIAESKATFFKNLLDDVHQLRGAMELSQNDTVRRVCLAIRRGAMQFALGDLVGICRDLERACFADNTKAIIEGVQALEVVVDRNLHQAEAC